VTNLAIDSGKFTGERRSNIVSRVAFSSKDSWNNKWDLVARCDSSQLDQIEPTSVSLLFK